MKQCTPNPVLPNVHHMSVLQQSLRKTCIHYIESLQPVRSICIHLTSLKADTFELKINSVKTSVYGAKNTSLQPFYCWSMPLLAVQCSVVAVLYFTASFTRSNFRHMTILLEPWGAPLTIYYNRSLLRLKNIICIICAFRFVLQIFIDLYFTCPPLHFLPEKSHKYSYIQFNLPIPSLPPSVVVLQVDFGEEVFVFWAEVHRAQSQSPWMLDLAPSRTKRMIRSFRHNSSLSVIHLVLIIAWGLFVFISWRHRRLL